MSELIYLEKQILQVFQESNSPEIPEEISLIIIQYLGYGKFHTNLRKHRKIMFPIPSNYIISRYINNLEGLRNNKFHDFYKDSRGIYVCYFCNISIPHKEKNKHLKSKKHIQNCVKLEKMTIQPYSNFNEIRIYEGNYFFIKPEYDEYYKNTFGKFCSCECGFTDTYTDDDKIIKKHLKSVRHKQFQLFKK